MGHDHHHHSSTSNLKVAFFLNLGFTILEIVGGIFVNSVAILSDAIHDLGDSIALGTAWYLERKSSQQSNDKYSFGFRRFSLLGALINSLILIISSVFVVHEAIARIMIPEPANETGMLLFAIFGVAVNGYAAWRMQGSESLNEKVVSWHLLEDVLGWAAVLVVAIVLHFWDLPVLDPILSLMITAYLLWNVVRRLRETLFIFLQGVPPDIDVEEIERQILAMEHVDSLHHTHIWSLEGTHHVFSTHVKLCHIQSLDQLLDLKNAIKALLHPYRFAHCTIETELDKETCGVDGSLGEN
jgi:cobalt-zinc-cadmium efflux system protein